MDMALNHEPRETAGRIEAIGWGVLLLMTGGLALIPGLPDGTWLAGLGVLLLALNAVRARVGLAAERFGVVLGIGAVAAGIGIMAGMDVPVFALLLVLCGAAIIAGQLVRAR